MKNLFSQENIKNGNRILYTPSGFAKNHLTHLQEIGQLHAYSPHTSRRENLDSYLFFIVEKGSGTLTYGGKIYPLHSGDCVFVDCHAAYSHRSGEDLWTLKWVHFNGPVMKELYAQYTERGGRPVFQPRHLQEYELLLEQLYDFAASENAVRDMRIYEKLTSLLTLLLEESKNPAEDTHASSLKRELYHIKDYLDSHYQEKISLDQLAEMFYINKFYMTRIFREQFGTTINSYLLNVRITHAKELLRFSDLPIEKIAHLCGMSDANYFARMFRKVEGCAPGEFRKHW